MRTLVISDLHLGNGSDFESFAGEEALPALLDAVSGTPVHVLVNGDGIDFLMNEDPLELDVARATAQAQEIARSKATLAVLAALGRVLARGGEVTIRLGNHDVELALPEVQEVFRGALGQPAEVAARLAFQTGEAPAVLEVGGARVLVTHGEQNDNWNKVDYGKLAPGQYTYAPGSLLVKQLMNPLVARHGMRFVNLLKPDFEGAVLTALAVAPAAMKVIFQSSTYTVLWQLFRKSRMAFSFDPEDAEADLGLAARVSEAGLTPEEQEDVEATFGEGPLSFADEGPSSAWVKLARAGLKAYASVERRLAGEIGDAYFDLAPVPEEWAEAQRLAEKFDAGAVVLGHTHAARWKSDEGLVFANSGTWISLMQLPRSDADDEVWTNFIAEIRENPRLLPERQKLAKTMSRFTAVSIDEHPDGGAAIALLQWDGRSTLRSLGAARVPARAPRA